MNLLSKYVNYIKSKESSNQEIGIIFGSGLSKFSNDLKIKKKIKYREIPNFPSPKVKGHSGEFIFSKLNDKNILFSNGRFHYYEGWSKIQIESIVKIFSKLGIKKIIITNSSGSILKKNKPPKILNITGYLDFTFISEKNPKIKYLTKKNSSQLSNSLKKAFKNKKIPYAEGIYAWTLGPSYETPSEIDYLKNIGVHAVGMSTVPEINIAKSLKMEIAVISCLTNYAAGVDSKIISHDDVLYSANRMSSDLFELIIETIKIL